MKKITVLVVSAICLLSFTYCSQTKTNEGAKESTEVSSEQVAYTCPMDPDVVSDKPGKCPKCGMELEKKEASVESDSTGHEGHGH